MKIFNIATYNRDELLLKTIDSIYNQADVINIALNSHTEVPNNLIDSKIHCMITDNSKGDGFKFLKLNESDGYYFTIDDDIIYPSNYSDYMIDGYNKYNEKHIITLHGRSFSGFPIKSYYRSPHLSFRCLGDVYSDNKVQFGGTGVMLFHTKLLKFDMSEIEHPNMADIWVSKIAKERGLDIICLQHKNDFLKYQYEVGVNTIWDNNVNSDNIQTNVANSIFM